jgi:hypothetical protein
LARHQFPRVRSRRPPARRFARAATGPGDARHPGEQGLRGNRLAAVGLRDGFEEFGLLLGRQANLAVLIAREDGDRRAFGQFHALDDDLAGDDGSGGDSHRGMVLLGRMHDSRAPAHRHTCPNVALRRAV